MAAVESSPISHEVWKSLALLLGYNPNHINQIPGTLQMKPLVSAAPFANARNFGISNAFLEPEKNHSVELGTKWELFNGRLSAEGSVFEIIKANAREHPGQGATTDLAGVYHNLLRLWADT